MNDGCWCCGQPTPIRGEGDPWEGRMDGYCHECATTRCDTTDSTCSIKGRSKGRSRGPIDVFFDDLAWESLPTTEPLGEIPVATHRGVLDFAGVEVIVYQLSNGERVIDAESVEALLGRLS